MCISLFIFGIFFLIKKKTITGIILILLFLLLGWVYIHIIRRAIDNKYKKCHKDLFYLTDYINRKFLANLGYYLLVDHNFKSIGIYLIPYHIWRLLQFRDKNIELKQQLIGDTIDHLYKKENNNKSNINYFKNNYFYNNNIKDIFNTHINYFSFGFNNNNNNFNQNNNNINNFNQNNNDLTFDDGNKNNTIIENKNNYNVSKNNRETIININIKKKKIHKLQNTDSNKKWMDTINNKVSKKYTDTSGTWIKNEKLNETKNEEMNTHVNDRSIDKLKDYIENRFNDLRILNIKRNKN